jgi:hypothetical protein
MIKRITYGLLNSLGLTVTYKADESFDLYRIAE